MFIDVHCHLDMLSKEGVSIEIAINNAKKNNVRKIVVNAVNPANSRIILEMASKFKEVEAAAGIYPIDALKLTDEEISSEISFISKNKDKILAIGEIGLDLKEDERNKGFEKQKENLEKFVKLGIKLNKPLIIHTRKAELDTIELLEKLNAKKVVMHCFMGKLNLAKRVADNGWFLSIPSCVKYVEQFQQVVKQTPIEKLLCETDSPYLHPDRGWPNEPANVIESYKKIAEIKGLSLKDVENKIEKNFNKLFGS